MSRSEYVSIPRQELDYLLQAARILLKTARATEDPQLHLLRDDPGLDKLEELIEFWEA